jgi:hypothetical protein
MIGRFHDFRLFSLIRTFSELRRASFSETSIMIVDFKLHEICSSMDQTFSEIGGEEDGNEVTKV